MDNGAFNSNEDSEWFIVQVLPLLLPADTQFLGFDFGAGVVPYSSYCLLLVRISGNGVSGASVPGGPCAPRAVAVPRRQAAVVEALSFLVAQVKALRSTARFRVVLLFSLLRAVSGTSDVLVYLSLTC